MQKAAMLEIVVEISIVEEVMLHISRLFMRASRKRYPEKKTGKTDRPSSGLGLNRDNLSKIKR
jgi:hypothetical protein